jgi:16S rRNA (guanine966-N2)-methyltransferase
MRVIAGKMKGRLIPFDNRSFNSAETTSQKLKKAAFSMMGEWLEGLRFLDLFACSGQMGFEACSRGANVVMVEENAVRFAFIRDLTREWSCGGSVRAVRGDAMKLLACDDFRNCPPFDVIYIDPPYDEHFQGEPLSVAAIAAASVVLGEDGVVLVQHPDALEMPRTSGPLILRKTRRYGKSAISCYEWPDEYPDLNGDSGEQP